MLRACVIGAGSSGLAAGKALKDAGVEFDLFESSDRVGGLWVYENPNGKAAAYRGLHSNAPKPLMGYAEYPLPDDLPDYPSHWDFAKYFASYADHFGVTPSIRFRTTVEKVVPSDRGGHDVTLDDGTTTHYDAVLVANGHHWNPRLPDPMFPGEFDGTLMHSRDYRDPTFAHGKRVVVVGFGNSAVDIASEISELAEATFLSVRRGVHIMPKYVFGMAAPLWMVNAMSYKVPRRLVSPIFRAVAGKPSDYGLPVPDHKFGDAHPTMSARIMDRLQHGKVIGKPQIQSLEGDQIQFADGTVEKADLVICCTGYTITFPFFDQDYIDAPGNRIRLYRRVVPTDKPGVFFVGLCQPLGAIQPIAEQQGKWIAGVLTGKYALPGSEEMEREIARDEEALGKRFYDSTRHTIQLDHYRYLKTMRSEMAKGRRRAAAAA